MVGANEERLRQLPPRPRPVAGIHGQGEVAGGCARRCRRSPTPCRRLGRWRGRTSATPHRRRRRRGLRGDARPGPGAPGATDEGRASALAEASRRPSAVPRPWSRGFDADGAAHRAVAPRLGRGRGPSDPADEVPQAQMSAFHSSRLPSGRRLPRQPSRTWTLSTSPRPRPCPRSRVSGPTTLAVAGRRPAVAAAVAAAPAPAAPARDDDPPTNRPLRRRTRLRPARPTSPPDQPADSTRRPTPRPTRPPVARDPPTGETGPGEPPVLTTPPSGHASAAWPVRSAAAWPAARWAWAGSGPARSGEPARPRRPVPDPSAAPVAPRPRARWAGAPRGWHGDPGRRPGRRGGAAAGGGGAAGPGAGPGALPAVVVRPAEAPAPWAPVAVAVARARTTRRPRSTTRSTTTTGSTTRTPRRA